MEINIISPQYWIFLAHFPIQLSIYWSSFLYLSEISEVFPFAYYFLSIFLQMHFSKKFFVAIIDLWTKFSKVFWKISAIYCQAIFVSFLIWQCHETCEILAPWPRLVPRLLAVKVWSPDHWTSRELLQAIFLEMFTLTFSSSKI